MAHITRLPVEILSDIHQRVMNSAETDPAPGHAQPDAQHPPPTPAQQARRAFTARANFSIASGLFHAVDKGNLALEHNAEMGCLVTKNTLRNLAPLDEKRFTQRVKALLQDNPNVAVDFSPLSEKQTRIVLKVLVEQAKKKPLRHLRFNVDLDSQSPKMLGKINAAITAIRKTTAGANTAVEFACSSRDKNRTAAPDLSRLTNLTSLDLSGCTQMKETPDFSKNPELIFVNMRRCGGMTTTPDFSKNPALMSVNLSACRGLTIPPDFSNNPALTSVNLSWCEGMTTAPDLSNKPLLKSANLSGLYLPPTTRNELRELLGDRLKLA